MKLIGTSFILALTASVISVAACSSTSSPSPSIGANAPTASGSKVWGSVKLNFTLPSGQTIGTVQYTLTNGTNTYTNTINLALDPSGSTTIADVASGTGYTVSLTEVTADGLTTCSGTSAPFTVTAGVATGVTIPVVCTAVSDAGAVTITPVPSDCPTWNTIVATPASATTAAPNNTSVFTASATAPSIAMLNYAWTVTSGTGTLSNQSAQGAGTNTITFTCPATAETDVITVVASDQSGAQCPTADTTSTVTIACTPAAVPDAGPIDSGSDASTPDAAPTPDAGPLTPCTTAGQTNCVQCDNSVGNLCSPTEAAIVNNDIAKGYVTGPGPEPASACYECLAQAGLLDDTSGDTGNECEDSTNEAQCLATVSCVLGTSCASTALNVCYCGTAPVSGSCNAVGAANAANGVCATQIAAGLSFDPTDGHDILANLISKKLPSGIADKIFQNAISNGCTTCLQ
jgi:hypothetical protein